MEASKYIKKSQEVKEKLVDKSNLNMAIIYFKYFHQYKIITFISLFLSWAKYYYILSINDKALEYIWKATVIRKNSLGKEHYLTI